MKSSLALSALALVLLSGCDTYPVNSYQTSPPTTVVILKSRIAPVAVMPFTASKPGLAAITCRAAGPVRASPDFAGYIENALIRELQQAGAYDPASLIKISGKLEEIDFSAGIDVTTWIFSLTVSDARQQSFTIRSTQHFQGSFFAGAACNMAKDYFLPAVQRLVRDLILDPRFREMARPSRDLVTQVFTRTANRTTD